LNVFLIGLLGLAVAYLSYRLYWETLDQPGFERGKSIAVLPFTNIVAETEPDTAYFSEGVTEEILNALSMVKELRVAARASSFALREVGNLTLLEATLQSHDAISKSIQLNNLLPEAQASLGLCILGGGDTARAT